MGSSNSKHPIDISNNNNKITIGITQCLNNELYKQIGINKYDVDKFSKNDLIATVEYNGIMSQVTANFTKNAIFEKGVVQFDRAAAQSFTLTLVSDGNPRWNPVTIQMTPENENKFHEVILTGSGTNDDGILEGAESASNAGVKVSYFYSSNISQMITPTRDGKDHSFINDDAIEQLQEGDIILYSGEGKLSNLIKNRFYRPYSHVGIVVKAYAPFPSTSTEKELFILESVGPLESVGDPFRSRQSLSGVTLFSNVKEHIKKYEGRSVQCMRMSRAMTDIESERFKNSVFSLHGARLPFDVLQASFLLLERLKLWNIQSNHSVFCSELVALVLYQAGLLPHLQSSGGPSNIDPGEVADMDIFDQSSLKFLKYDV